MAKFVIWQNYDVDVEDWKDFLEECHPDVTDEYEKQSLVNKENDSYLDDERDNLDIETEEEIIEIADIGRWNGRFTGYKEPHWTNINQCLSFEDSCGYAEFYVDQYGNLRSKQSHHDGTHYILYREWKPGLNYWQKQDFLNKIYSGKMKSRDVTRYTRSLGKRVKEVYGW